MSKTFNILAIGDVVGSPGRELLQYKITEIKEKFNLHFIIANGENASGGMSIAPKNANEILSYGIDLITSGNHIWHNKNIFEFIDKEPRLIRPANYPSGVPGRGYYVRRIDETTVCTINLIGRINLIPVDCPFRKFDEIYKEVEDRVDIIIVDFHAEATSEKQAFGWYVDGRASAVFGTHTHVQTADERILDRGTGFITDVGMTGSFNSVIGMNKEKSINNFLTYTRIKHEVASGDAKINCVLFSFNSNGNVIDIKRIFE